jgi:hypothetical protein
MTAHSGFPRQDVHQFADIGFRGQIERFLKLIVAANT